MASPGTPKKSLVTELNKFLNYKVRVKLVGGREVTGVLKGHDAIVDLVLDEAYETLRDPNDRWKLTDEKRYLGLIVAKGTAVVMIYPDNGTEEISNPFVTE